MMIRTLAVLRPSTAAAWAIPSSSRTALLSTAAAAGTQNATGTQPEIKCVECGGLGHRAKDCPKAAGTAKKNVQDFFKQGKCLLCGEVGHEAKHCPTIGGQVEESKPLAPKPARLTLSERNANKICMQCGVKGHVMRDCPTNPSTVKIKGIRDRYSGSRLQKMLPELLKDTKTLAPAHESFASVPPQMGIVVSTSAQKTIGVLVQRSVTHPKLKITLDRSQKFLVHDEEERAVCGDVVMIQQTRPISKRKNFALKEIVLSLNERKGNVAKKVQEAKKVYENINEEAVATLEKLREEHLERIAQLKKQEMNEMQEVRARIQTEMNERMKDVNSIVDDAASEARKGSEAWLQQMKRKLETSDQWVKAVGQASTASNATSDDKTKQK